MDKKRLKKLRKLLVNLLGKNPAEFLLISESDGWIRISDLHHALMEIGVTHLTPAGLIQHLSLFDRDLFEVDAEGKRARFKGAAPETFCYEPRRPPNTLFVPIRPRAYFSVERSGIGPRGRRWLTLLASRERALIFGKRFHHSPLIVKILAENAHLDGTTFCYAGSQLYLTEDWIGPELLKMPPAPVVKKEPEPAEPKNARGDGEQEEETWSEGPRTGPVLAGTFLPSMDVFEDFYREKERRALKRAKKAKDRKKRKRR